jgi:hypothetical protein
MTWPLPALASSFVIVLAQPSVAGDLYEAALAGKAGEVARLLAAGADVNDEGNFGTALACRRIPRRRCHGHAPARQGS